MDPTKARSERLYNKELAPESATDTWSTGSLFNWWMSGWHSLGGYTMAIGLFAFGLTGWQVIIAFIIGVIILYFANNLSGVAGQREGVPFPVFARGSFGVYGANIPAILRAIVAVAWYGIQTYLASAALMLLVLKLFPEAMPMTETTFLGLSALGWICFLALSIAQAVVLLLGLEAVRRLSDFAGPTIWVAMFALAAWVLSQAGWTIDLSHTTIPRSEGTSVAYGMLAAAFLTVAYFAGPSLNFADFTRNAPSEKAVKTGNSLGLLINASAFGALSVVIALASVEVYGEAVSDPIELLAEIDSVAALLVAIIAIAVATAGINIILNYVSPVYDLINVWPRAFTFKRAGLVVALLAIVITPWNLFSNPVLVNQFIGGVGALMGPLLGVILVDYYLVQGRRYVTDDLFSDEAGSRYVYTRGYNQKAIVALLVAGVFTVGMSIIPIFSQLAPFAWPVGLVISSSVYYVLNLQQIQRNGSETVAPGHSDVRSSVDVAGNTQEEAGR